MGARALGMSQLLQDTLLGALQADPASCISQLPPSPLLHALQASSRPAPGNQCLQLLPGPGFVGAVRRALQRCPCLQALPPHCLISWRALHHGHICPVLQCRHSVTAVPADQDCPVLAVQALCDSCASGVGLACACRGAATAVSFNCQHMSAHQLGERTCNAGHLCAAYALMAVLPA